MLMTRTIPKLLYLGLIAGGLILLQACSESVTDTVNKPLLLSVDSLEFMALAGQNPSPAQQKVRVFMKDKIITDWSATFSESWLRLGPGGTDTIFVSVISTDLATGVYHDTIQISAPDATNTPLPLPVRLTVTNRLVIEPEALSFVGLSGGSVPDSQSVVITDFVGGSVDYTATTDAGWLTLTGVDGSTPDTVFVQVDLTGLEGGQYVDSIVLTSDELPDFRGRVFCYLNLSSWVDQTLGPGGASLNLVGVRFVDPDNGWVSAWLPSSSLSPHGLVYRSDDGGDSWNRVLDMWYMRFGGLDAIDAATCFVVGDSAQISFTRNGGADWDEATDVEAGPDINLSQVDFAGVRYGWATGLSGTVLHSADSGHTWDLQVTPTTFDLTDVTFANETTGWVSGNHGTVLHTTDGGNTWTIQNTGTVNDLLAVCFVNVTDGWTVGADGAILHTTNGGAVWQLVGSSVNTLLTDVTFVNETRGWVIGIDGSILHTNDEGITWLDQPTEKDVGLSEIFFVTDSIGWVVGDAGTILNTASGGF
jgi:photosystem II stability/assembly factor-like uncharacterized protein